MVLQEAENLFSRMFKDISFSPTEVELLVMSFKKIDIKKGERLLSVGEKVDIQYYIDTGCLRSFSTDNSGKEYTFMFAISDWWMSDYYAYFNEKPSIMSIECIQDATIYSISRARLHYLYKEIPIIETFFRGKLERAFASFQKRILSNISQSASHRYSTFMATYPKIEQNIKNYHIASYLGITTESLSRIRKEDTKD